MNLDNDYNKSKIKALHTKQMCTSCLKRQASQITYPKNGDMVTISSVGVTRNLEDMFTTGQTTIISKSGQSISLSQALLRPYARPHAGWFVKFLIKGIPNKIKGASANDTFFNTKSILNLNNIEVSDNDLWVNLNLQWLERASEGDSLVFLADLYAISSSSSKILPAVNNEPIPMNYSPSMWGSIAWNWLGLYLASDVYLLDDFKFILKQVKELLDPNVNSSTGCEECFLECAKELSKLDYTGWPRTQEEARTWLYTFHNEVNGRIGKPVISREEANIKNNWK